MKSPIADNRSHQASIAEACSDDAEVLALSVLRFVAAGYMTGDIACWEAAHDGAERLLGAIEGADLVAAMTRLMRAIRAERHGEWRFMPATCCRVTSDEARIVGLLALARRDSTDLPALRSAAAASIGCEAAPRVATAARAAADLLDSVQPLLRASATEAPRRTPAPGLH
jgi:hypothetical protein